MGNQPPSPKAPGTRLDPLDPLEQQARAFLAAGKWRKARDEFKELCKVDRARFLPLLIQANLGLARDMAGKGQTSEATQVLAYLKTIAQPADWKPLELQLALKTGAASETSAEILGLLSAAGPGAGEADRWRLADQLVVAFAPAPAAAPAEAAVARDLAAIHQALRALSGSQFEALQESLRPVSQQSPFHHWKLWLKGLAAYYRGDSAKAARFFGELPAGSVPALAAEPLLLLLAKTLPGVPRPMPNEAALARLCQWLGTPGLARTLVQSQKAWQDRGPVEAYLRLAEVWRKAFPAVDAGWAGALTDFFFKCAFQLPRDECESFLNFLEDLGESSTHPVERCLALQHTCLFGTAVLPASLLEQYWREFLYLRSELWGANARLDSQALAWLGAQLAMPEARAPSPFRFWQRPGSSAPRAAEPAIQALVESGELDPENLPAALGLCKLYETLRRTSDRNRLLDQLTVRFPQRKEVLVEAGRLCLERKAFKKGLDYLERARQLDLLDTSILDKILGGRLEQALANCSPATSKDKAAKILAELEQAEALTTEDPGNFRRGRWLYLTSCSVLAQGFGQWEKSSQLRERALAAAPFRAAVFLALCWLQDEWLRLEARLNWNSDWKACLKSANLEQGCLLATLIQDLFARLKNVPQWEFKIKARRLFDFLLAATGRPCHPETVARFLTATLPLFDNDGSGNVFAQPHRLAIRRALKQDPRHPLLRLYCVKFPSFTGRFRRRAGQEREVRSILAEAEQRGDSRTADQARTILKEFTPAGRPGPRPFDIPVPEGFFNDGLDDGLDDEDLRDGPDDDDGRGTFHPLIPPMISPRLKSLLKSHFENWPLAKVEEVMSDLALAVTASPIERLKLEGKLVRSLPLELVRAFIQELSLPTPAPDPDPDPDPIPAPPPPARKKNKPPPPEDPRQTTLF
jgi:hypothetical protein